MKNLFFLSLSLIVFDLYAKKPIDSSYHHRGESYYVIIPSYHYTSAIGLNSILKQQGAPTISRSNFMAGLGFEDRWKWLSLGCDFVYGVQEHSNDRYNITAPVLVSNVWIKYYLLKNKEKGGLYPFGGISIVDKSVFITDKNAAGDINQLFTQSGAVNMNLSNGFVQFGVGADAINFTKEDNVYFSFKMGYRINVSSSFDNQWYVNDRVNLAGSPTEQLNAFFIQLAVGYSSNRKSNRQQRNN